MQIPKLFAKVPEEYAVTPDGMAIDKIVFIEDGTVKENRVWAKDPEQLQTTDRIIMDEKGNG